MIMKWGNGAMRQWGNEESNEEKQRAGAFLHCPTASLPHRPIASFLQPRACQLRDGRERGLRRVEAETKVLVAIGRKNVARLVPVRIPSRLNVAAPLVFPE